MSQARLNRIETPHGAIETPVFMPVGTAATVKATTVDTLEEMGTQIILGNTYHLMLRPGHETIRQLGGLHKFMNWNRPILTDSGGYQVFSLALLRKLNPEGVEFRSHIDGEKFFLSPEFAIEIQQALGSDIMMVLDECPPYPVSESDMKKSMDLTIDWARRSLLAKKSPRQGGIFGIVQGSNYPHLRKECVDRLLEIHEQKRTPDQFPGFSGLAIGGLSVGEPKELMYEAASIAAAAIPDRFPKYAMGIGLPEDLIEMAGFGIDMFDCVVPTRNARNGELFTSFGEIQIRHARYKEDPNPIDENCSCRVCKKYSRAYLRHLYMAKEILSPMLNTIHNLHYYLSLMKDLREAIRKGHYGEFRRNFYQLRSGSGD